MKNATAKLRELVRSDEGAAGVEYGILLGAVAGLLVLAAISIGGKIGTAFTNTDTAITGAPFE